MPPEGTEGTPAAAGNAGDGQQPTATPAPAGQSEMKELLEGFRTLQGQVRRFEARQATLEASLGALSRKPEPDQPRGRAKTPAEVAKAALARLDDSDPAVSSVKQAMSAFTEYVESLEERVSQVHRRTDQQLQRDAQQSDRSNIWIELQHFAHGRPVDMTGLQSKILALPTDDMWQEGKRLILEAAKGNAVDETSIRADERKKIADEFGLYPEERPGILTQPQDIDALSRLNDGLNRGDIEVSEFETRAAAILKKAM